MVVEAEVGVGVVVAGPQELQLMLYQLPRVDLQNSVRHQQQGGEVGQLVSHSNSRMHNHNEVVEQHYDKLEELQKIHMLVPEVQVALMRQGAFRVEAQLCMKGLGMVRKKAELNVVGPTALGLADNSQEEVAAEGPYIAEGEVGNWSYQQVAAPVQVVVL